MILKDIGEVGVHAGEKTYVLRPSLYAMSMLGEPADIVAVFARLAAGQGVEGEIQGYVADALAVIYSCCDEDLSDVFGYWGERGYVPGRVPVSHVIALAQCLLKHGIVGALPELPRRAGDEPEYVKEFDARAHVAMAMAHLGMSEREAWNCTMTALVGALRTKFPRPESNAPGAKAPTKEEHNATMEWFERVEAARRKRQGAH
ncbi:DUF6246 family protein [Bordetella sp. BOR01]|uniref:DUF6246 family protein n=1 Tax=Bordetella sp. BOR01 TaxID=2854779 RepID=UPI001C47C6C3|nr:DUF6246 family protein [Bordetella sp. BOR01]MBV7482527.1 hypothetical protein [Bordetella sp. BOR01]